MAELERAYVLHRKAYRESSLIIDFFTYQQGRLQAVARGGRRQNSRWRSLLHPFQKILITANGQGSLKTLTHAEPDGAGMILQGERLACGFYLNELITRLFYTEDPHPLLFDYYETALYRVANDSWPAPSLRIFEKHLLDELGYGVSLQQDINGQPLDGNAVYHYNSELGGLVKQDRDDNGVSGQTLLAASANDLKTKKQCHEIRRLFQGLLARLLDDKPLYSRQLLRSTGHQN